MAKAVKRPAESWIYVLKADRGLEERERSVFTLAPLTYAQRAGVRDDMQRAAAASSDRVHRAAAEIAVTHIVLIENFPAGEPQPWPKSRGDRERYIEMLDDDHVLEIGDEIWGRSSLGFRSDPDQDPKDGDLLKNSPTPEDTSVSGKSPMTIASSTTALHVSATPS